MQTWAGECVLTPLAYANEESGYEFPHVLDILLRVCRDIDVGKPYEIEDLKRGVTIRTNAPTHVLARGIRREVNHAANWSLRP